MPNSTPAQHEKCTEELKIRLPESMRDLLMRLAYAEDRAPSEYVRHVLAMHLYGHARQLAEDAPAGAGPNVPSEGPRKKAGA